MRDQRSIPILATLLVCGLALLIAPVATAQEHPEEQAEHPEEKAEHSEKHAEHPEEKAAPEITKEELAQAIRDHVEHVAAEHGGTYPLEDPKTGETLQLDLDKVHQERLARTAPHTYFACVDFAGQDGTMYDVDFFMKGKSAEALEFKKFSIHKVDGEARYTWHEKKGKWKKKKVGEKGEHEHPEEGDEHPEEEPEHPDEPPVR